MTFNYEKYKKEILLKGGINPEVLSNEQIDVILQPSEAPENYMCDGEISPQQAFASWKFRLNQVKLNKDVIDKAIALQFT